MRHSFYELAMPSNKSLAELAVRAAEWAKEKARRVAGLRGAL
jgi:hypothetical protein